VGPDRTGSDRSDDGAELDFGETFRVHDDMSGRRSRPEATNRPGVLGRRRRVWAWLAFAALLAYTPVEAYLVRANGPFAVYAMPPDSWLLSATVAALVGFVLIVDDVERRKIRAAATPGDES
jgi:hypothetical protein